MSTPSEQVLEDILMTLLISKDYEWAKVTDEASMLANLKTQLEDFNRLSLSDGLIQAYSRTNRILNEVKSQGNIVVFRNLKKATDRLFSPNNLKHMDAKRTKNPQTTIRSLGFSDIIRQIGLIRPTPNIRPIRQIQMIRPITYSTMTLQILPVRQIRLILFSAI